MVGALGVLIPSDAVAKEERESRFEGDKKKEPLRESGVCDELRG